MERDSTQETHAAAAAMDLLDRHMAALNANDAKALAETLHFPHYRLAGTRMQVWETAETYFRDFLARAGEGWHHSTWNFRHILHASPNKVHVDLEFTRYRADNTALGTYRSIWVVTHIGGKWGAQLRSSFAG